MKERYAEACSAYLAEFIKTETRGKMSFTGWYHFIDDPDYKKVGVVATAQILILIKDCMLDVTFDCNPMLQSLLDMQNPDGGWSYKSNIWDSATEPTALSVQALLLWRDTLSEKAAETIQKGVSWLLKYKNDAGLWGPIKKRERKSFIYFSCIALRCLHRVLNASPAIVAGPLLEQLESALSNGCDSLLKAFHNSDFQCGWGSTEKGKATLFHTAYSIVTLLEIDPEYAKKHAVMKSVAFLSDAEINDCKEGVDSPFQNGMHEIYQSGKQRLSHVHSVDTYVLLALLYGGSEEIKPMLIERCKYYFTCAERTNWNYQGFVTFWRLYDIVRLCHKCTEFMSGRRDIPMKHFKIALTFAGESRGLVEQIADKLAKRFCKEEILYDRFHEADFARPGLYTYLQDLYHDNSDLIVVFLCDEYSQKPWCVGEWRAVLDILNRFEYEKIMYVYVGKDDIKSIRLPGFYASEDGCIDANTHSPQEIFELIIKRYESTCIVPDREKMY